MLFGAGCAHSVKLRKAYAPAYRPGKLIGPIFYMLKFIQGFTLCCLLMPFAFGELLTSVQGMNLCADLALKGP